MQRGVTLAGLLIRIALGLLCLLPIGMVLFPVCGCPRPRSWRASSINNMHQLHQAITLYVDSQGYLPPMDSPVALRNALASRVKAAPDIFVDPKSGRPLIPNPALSGRKMKDLKQHSETVVLLHPYLDESADGRVAVLCLDGRVRLIRWRDFRWMPPSSSR